MAINIRTVGAFLDYAIAGEYVRRKSWPSNNKIYTDYPGCNIFYDNENKPLRKWEPTHENLMATDWEIV